MDINDLEACDLFDMYVGLLDQEFHDSTHAKNAHRECIMINAKLMKLGFVILAHTEHHIETRTYSDDTIQAIIIFTYDVILIKNEIPIRDPLAYASAVSKVFGPPVVVTTHPPISAQEETWLHSMLDPFGTTEKGD